MNNYYKYLKYKNKYLQAKKYNQYGGIANIENWSQLTDLNPVEISYSGNQPLMPNVLPNSVTILKFGDNFNQPIHHNTLSTSLELLMFGSGFNQPIEPGVLPNSIEELHFGSFNQPLSVGVLPTGLVELRFGTFNQPINNSVLPDTIEWLIFDLNFNQPIEDGALPDRLTILSFPNDFNQPITIWPSNLETLTISRNYSYPIPSSISNIDYVGTSFVTVAESPEQITDTSLDTINDEQEEKRHLVQNSQTLERENISHYFKHHQLIDKIKQQQKQLGERMQTCPICFESIYSSNSSDEYISDNCVQDMILMTSCCQKYIHQCCAEVYFKPIRLHQDFGESIVSRCPMCRSKINTDTFDKYGPTEWKRFVFSLIERGKLLK